MPSSTPSIPILDKIAELLMGLRISEPLTLRPTRVYKYDLDLDVIPEELSWAIQTQAGMEMPQGKSTEVWTFDCTFFVAPLSLESSYSREIAHRFLDEVLEVFRNWENRGLRGLVNTMQFPSTERTFRVVELSENEYWVALRFRVEATRRIEYSREGF